MTTLAQACKAIVTDAVDHDYLLECGSLHTVYQSEYGSYNGTSPKACKDYLQGLPSVCTVPFDNYDILSLIGDSIGVDFNDDDRCSEAIEAYWNECGYQFYKMVK